MIKILQRFFGIQPIDYRELISRGAIIVDVRSQHEYKSGHISGSRNYPLDNIRTKLTDLRKMNKPVITVCLSGARSAMAKNILKSAGIEAYNGGAWTRLQSKLREF